MHHLLSGLCYFPVFSLSSGLQVLALVSTALAHPGKGRHPSLTSSGRLSCIWSTWRYCSLVKYRAGRLALGGGGVGGVWVEGPSRHHLGFHP